jgi:hypothetical protein
MLMKELFLVACVAALAICISVVWKGDEIFSHEEFQNHLYRVERGEGLR